MHASIEHLARFTLYESRRGFWIVGQTVCGSKFRILHLRPTETGNLRFKVQELEHVFSLHEIDQWIAQQKELAKQNDDDEFCQKAPSAWGLLGLIRFTGCYYICMVTKCSVVAILGQNKIYHVDETKLVPLVHSSRYEVPDRRSAEARLASTFRSLDLAKTFYFSPTYDLTNTLQGNMHGVSSGPSTAMFVWNSHLLTPIASTPDAPAQMDNKLRANWFIDMIHGFIDQARISVFGNSVYITLIARRSHQFAGARFFKRGVNLHGYPANEVETEQIVSNQLHSQLSDRYTSYVQHRGSICVSWSQMSNNMSPQPPIKIDVVDPYYEAAAKHFDRMLSRYGCPIRLLNLVKTREKRARESLLSDEFETCVCYLNQFLPQKRSQISESLESRSIGLKQISLTRHGKDSFSPSGTGLSLEGGIIEYTHWDMSRAAKSRSTEVMDYLGKYAKMTLETTSIFQQGKSIQQGVCRTNCIDCLDRTNAAQSVIAKHALGHQLYALGIIDRPKVDYDTDVMDLLTEMYHDHGDTLALQYGGSNLVNTVETYRRINQWTSHSRDLIESIRRFYSNSFMDAQRQDAINVFLGNYQYTEGTNLWDLSTDYYLHNVATDDEKRSYRQWYQPRHLLKALSSHPLNFQRQPTQIVREDWSNFTSLSQLFMSQINSTNKYSKQLSPFEPHFKTKSRQKDTQSIYQSHATTKPHKENTFPLVNELELLYTKYMCPNTSGMQSIITTQPDEMDYQKYFDMPVMESEEYVLPEGEWSGTPLNQWNSAAFESYAAFG